MDKTGLFPASPLLANAAFMFAFPWPHLPHSVLSLEQVGSCNRFRPAFQPLY